MCIHQHVDEASQECGFALLALLLVHRDRRAGSKRSLHLLEQRFSFPGVHEKRPNGSIEGSCAIAKIVSQMPRQLRRLPARSAELGCRQRKLGESNLDFLLAWNLDLLSQPVCVAYFFADGPDVRPERLRQADKAGGWPHRRPFSSRRTNSWSETPTARQTRRSSRTSKRRSPDSYLLTNDCGTPRREASSLCVNPASTRALRSSPRNRSCSSE